jgi:hypothetical protein
MNSNSTRLFFVLFLAIAVLIFTSSSSAYFSIQNLRYNAKYECNGETIVVGHCRSDDDGPGMARTQASADHCIVYYPSRPKKGGFTVQESELRSDVLRKLTACNAFNDAKDIKARPASADEEEWIKKYLDADGGYRDSKGGYYNPKAGTYTDKEGGVADNWGGYTYKDGSYKSKLGDFYDAPNKTFKLADGTQAKVENLTAEQAIKALRDNVKANGGYDKNLTLNSMIDSIKLDHPAKSAAKPTKS